MKLTKEIAGAAAVLAGVGLMAALAAQLLTGCTRDDGRDLVGPPEEQQQASVSGCVLPPPPDAGADAFACPDGGDVWVVPGEGRICL
jgi:hypothetical protein